jgi:putative AlgH/UPF0301 family transcriptional regulator
MKYTTIQSFFLFHNYFTKGFAPSWQNGNVQIKRPLHNPISMSKDDEEEIDISNRDWRAFRAQLVMQDSAGSQSSTSPSDSPSLSDPVTYDDDLDGIGSLFTDEDTPMNKENFTPLEPSQWAYDSGHVIEQGAVILGGVEQDFGFGLRQQYFHKAVILVIDHDEKVFTKGIILNRPTDQLLMDENNNKWRIWFGGDVQNLSHYSPEICCIHSISGVDAVDEVSNIVMKDIQWTSFDDAKQLVKEGHAETKDFWVFAGYAGWGPKQLYGELNRKSWYMCATDSQTLLKELANQSSLTDPRDCGLDTWELLMSMIGRGEAAEECSGDFEDLMLKEWARENLLSVEAGGNAGIRLQPDDVAYGGKNMIKKLPVDDSIASLKSAAERLMKAGNVKVGSLIRASSKERSPFLLKNQEYHKSITLIISQEENITIGIILNQPSTKSIEMDLVDKRTGVKKVVKLPVRFGGQYAIRGQTPLLWMHAKDDLRKANVGSPVGPNSEIWKCTQDEATSAIGSGLAKPVDFLIVSGLSIWISDERDSLSDQIKNENFEIVPSEKVSKVWDALLKQEILTKLNLLQNLARSDEAWSAGGNQQAKLNVEPLTLGIGEGFDEENDSFVYKSDVRVETLSDDARRSWVATFLLGAPSLGA